MVKIKYKVGGIFYSKRISNNTSAEINGLFAFFRRNILCFLHKDYNILLQKLIILHWEIQLSQHIEWLF
jgi:hypothetical protein